MPDTTQKPEPITLPEIKPGYKTTEGGAAVGVIATFALPLIQQMLSKTGDTTVEVHWIGGITAIYIAARTYLKAKELDATALAMRAEATKVADQIE